MRQALRLARRGLGRTSPNPAVGAVLVRSGKILGQGWHRGTGRPHAEIEALRDAGRRGHSARDSTLYVTLEPCSTHGRTPPCTEAILAAGIKRVVAATADPNPAHAGRAFTLLRNAGIKLDHGLLQNQAEELNEAFNHWIVHGRPFVTLKSAMTLDGKIASVTGESKWITGEKARAQGMKLRRLADAILVGINTVLADDPALTVRPIQKRGWRRIILDTHARIPLTSRVIQDNNPAGTIVVTGKSARRGHVGAVRNRVQTWEAPTRNGKIHLNWLLTELGRHEITHLLVEGGGEINAAFLEAGLVQRVAFFYGPRILGGNTAPKAVGGTGARKLSQIYPLHRLNWRLLGPDLYLTARVDSPALHP